MNTHTPSAATPERAERKWLTIFSMFGFALAAVLVVLAVDPIEGDESWWWALAGAAAFCMCVHAARRLRDVPCDVRLWEGLKPFGEDLPAKSDG